MSLISTKNVIPKLDSVCVKFHQNCAPPKMIENRSENIRRLGQNVSGYMIYRNQVFINGYARQTQNMFAKLETERIINCTVL